MGGGLAKKSWFWLCLHQGSHKQKEETEFILKAFFVFLNSPLQLLNLGHLRPAGQVTITLCYSDPETILSG